MSDAIDIDLAVRTLGAALRDAEQLPALPSPARPRSLAEGYDIQDRFVAAVGPATAGWKLGVGSHQAKLASGLGRSIAGRVLGDAVFASGDTVPRPHDAPVTIEIELGFVLGQDVLPGHAPADPRALIGEIRLTAELVLSRFKDRRAVGWPSFAADNAAFHALVLGAPIALSVPDSLEALRRTLQVEVNGQRRVGAATGGDITDPVQAFSDLLAHAADRNITLRRGEIVTTGSQSEPFALQGAATVRATCEFGHLEFSTDVSRVPR